MGGHSDPLLNGPSPTGSGCPHGRGGAGLWKDEGHDLTNPEFESGGTREVAVRSSLDPNYHPQKIQMAGLRWICPNVQTEAQVTEALLVEHYIAILLFKPKNWGMCHTFFMLEEGVTF